MGFPRVMSACPTLPMWEFYGKARTDQLQVLQNDAQRNVKTSVVMVIFPCSSISLFLRNYVTKQQVFNNILGGGFKDFLFSPLLGEVIQFD